jgi:hypothetical protein
MTYYHIPFQSYETSHSFKANTDPCATDATSGRVRDEGDKVKGKPGRLFMLELEWN